MASGKKATRQSGVTLEALMDRLNEIDANQSVRALRREAALEERLLRAVDDKISAAMADVRASLGSQPGDRLISRRDDENVSGVKAKSKEAEEDMDSAYASYEKPMPTKFRAMIGNKFIYALIGSASSNSFITPTALQGVEEKCKIVRITPRVFEDFIGGRKVSDTECQGLTYSIQGYEFRDDFLVHGYI